MLQVRINDDDYTFEEGLTILQALRSIGIELPTLCHDERLTPYGGCRLCIVAVSGHERPLTACNTSLENGMIITTHSDDIEHHRRTLLRFIAQHYPKQALQKSPDNELHRYLRDYEVIDALRDESDSKLIDDSHPYLHVDMSQCIYCFRCVRICDDLQGQNVWQVWNRGDATKIQADSGSNLLESSCVSCGACVDTCPSGALADKTVLEWGEPTQWTQTTCPYCGTGCKINVGVREQRIVTVRPVLEDPVSKGHLCVKGRYAFDFTQAQDRITEPLLRENGQWQSISWKDAIEFIRAKMSALIDQYGPDCIGVLGSSRATNEENYLTQKFARTVLSTNNVDCCARVCHTPTAAAMKMMLGTGAATNCYDDIERAQTLLICGCNPTENHPVIGARIKQQVLRGANLIVIDPRRTEIAAHATVHLALRPGTNIPLLNALAHVIVEEELYDPDFLNDRINEWGEFRQFITAYAPEKVSEICRVDADLIRRAARLYATAKPAMAFHGLGLTEHLQGTEGVMCLVNLALLTGNIGKPGCGVNPLRGQNNVQGAAHMGCDRGILTGAVGIKEYRTHFEELWQADIPARKGLHLMEMMDAAAAQQLKALWAIGYDVFLSLANANVMRQAFENLELVIIQDMFMTETAKEFGTVFLPVASSFEKDGTFMNAERRIQRVRQVLPAPGAAKSDWEIICELARALGKGELFAYENAEAIWDEIRTVWPAAAGISYARIEHGGLQWPCPTTDHPGTSMLHGERFSHDKETALRRIGYQATTEVTDANFPYLLTTGRDLYQFNANTMTGRTANTLLHPTDYLDISPADGSALKIRNGDQVTIRSRYGQATLPVRVNPDIKPGELFATFHTAEVFLNHVTSPIRDNYVQAPEYKVTAVQITGA